jgi:protein-S-isoprenylcysteine O-methyltransferase Ste14
MAGIGLITASNVFPSSFEEYLFYAAFFLWLLCEVVGASIIPGLRRGDGAIKRRDKGSNLLIYGAIYVAICIAFVVAGDNIAMLPNWFFYPGIILMLLGIIVRQWSISILGRFFSTAIGVQKEHKVVDSGPYRYIRHPSYLGALLTFIGIGLALCSWGAIIPLLIMFTLAYGYRMQIEEKFLTSELGEDYIQYMKRTRRLIPYIY